MSSGTASCATSPASCPSAARPKSTVARKLAAIRTFYRQLVERGELSANPADLVSSPKKDKYLPRVLKPGEVSELLERIPASSPLDLRDRAMLELAYAAGLRAEELVNLDTDGGRPRRRAGARRRQGRPHPRGPGRRARLEGARALSGARAARARPATARRSSSRRADAACRPRTSGAGCGFRPAAPASLRTRCATRSRPIYSREEPICGRSRSCSGTPPSARPRRTLG